MTLELILSGGQTGVDRAALDAALGAGIPCGGWCPKNRTAEDGPIPDRYPLRQTASEDVMVRTELNVLDADATLILTTGSPADGTPFARSCAEHYGKALLVVDLDSPLPASAVHSWIQRHSIRVLNVGGPRESHRPGFVYRSAYDYLLSVFSTLGSSPPKTSS